VSRIELTDGSPVPEDLSHTQLRPDGQQKDYIVLSAEERAKGFVKPVRRSYVHKVCGSVTTMGRSLAETYARNPYFYSGTFCCHCAAHFDLDQFEWEDGEPMDPILQKDWHIEHDAKVSREKEDRRARRIAELKRELAELEASPPAEMKAEQR
jgi:hypothetical protein